MGKYERLFNVNKAIFRVYGFLISIQRMPLIIKTKPVLRRNIYLKDKKKTEKCFIIGLGPSLKQVDLTKLDGDLIVTNRYYKTQGADETSPTAYVLVDNAFFNKLDDFIKAKKMFPDCNYIVSSRYYEEIKKISTNDNNFYVSMWKGFFSPNNNIDLCKIMPMSNNVACTAIMLALYMEYREIYLLGCDFNSFASQTAIHAYEETNNGRLWSMSDELFQYSFAADMHVQLQRYAKRKGVVIYNATRGSLIDAYQRIEIDIYKKVNDENNE